MTLVIILKITLQRDIGQKIFGLEARSSLGIKARKVAMNAGRMSSVSRFFHKFPYILFEEVPTEMKEIKIKAIKP